jgi:hypothetical protein
MCSSRSTLFAFIFALLLSFIAQSQTAQKTRLAGNQTYCLGTAPCVLTAKNDDNRDGTNPNETVLKASTLTATSHPTPRWLATTDGLLYAQPLYLHQLLIGGVDKNVVYAATENNSVYAFDSDSTSTAGTVLAQVNLNNASDLSAGTTEIAVPYTDLPTGCTLLVPEVGITGTPVIDVSVTPPVMYVVTKHEDVDSTGAKTYRYKLHGLYADTLQEIPGSPLVIDTNFATANAPGFDPLDNHQRPGLALIPSSGNSSQLWVGWGSNCDDIPYYGFLMGFTYNYATNPGFSTTYTVVNSAPTCTTQRCQSGIWMSGGAPAVDSSGNVYLATGNGADETQGDGEYSNSIFRITQSGLQDFYTPPDYNGLNVGETVVACTNPKAATCSSPCALDSTGQYCQVTLVHNDWDLGAGGVTLLSPTFQLTNPEIMAAGKQGMLYVAYANNLGHVDAHSTVPDEYACTLANAPEPGAIAQCFQAFPVSTNPKQDNSGLRGSAAFLAGYPGTTYNFLYAVGVKDVLKAFLFQNQSGVGRFEATPFTATSPHNFTPGASPSVTWNSNGGKITDGIVWAIDVPGVGQVGKTSQTSVLYAYRAIPVSHATTGGLGAELWDTSAYASSNPGNPGSVKFIAPTIVDGKIFIGGGAQGYAPATANCPTPTTTIQPTSCGGLAMFE